MPWPAPSRLRHVLHPARLAAASITARARGSFMWRSRNARGSSPRSAASSSMKDSIANTLAIGTERAQRRGPDRHGQQTVTGDLERGQVVERHRVALRPAAVGHRRVEGDEAFERLGEMRGREHGRNRRPSRPRHVAVAPNFPTPVDDLTLLVEVGLDLDRHRGAHRRPGELVLARPLHAHRAPAAARASSTASKATSSAPLWP